MAAARSRLFLLSGILMLLSLVPATVTGGWAEGSPGAVPAWKPREGAELVGTRAPEWSGIRWIQGGPLTLAGLRGRVVLLRFWLADCPFCERTAPALRELDERYRERGLVVVAVHHPKSEESRDLEKVARAAKELGFS